jgi:hypothetical protein
MLRRLKNVYRISIFQTSFTRYLNLVYIYIYMYIYVYHKNTPTYTDFLYETVVELHYVLG